MWGRDDIGVWCGEEVVRVMWERVGMWDDETVGWVEVYAYDVVVQWCIGMQTLIPL